MRECTCIDSRTARCSELQCEARGVVGPHLYIWGGRWGQVTRGTRTTADCTWHFDGRGRGRLAACGGISNAWGTGFPLGMGYGRRGVEVGASYIKCATARVGLNYTGCRQRAPEPHYTTRVHTAPLPSPAPFVGLTATPLAPPPPSPARRPRACPRCCGRSRGRATSPLPDGWSPSWPAAPRTCPPLRRTTWPRCCGPWRSCTTRWRRPGSTCCSRMRRCVTPCAMSRSVGQPADVLSVR